MFMHVFIFSDFSVEDDVWGEEEEEDILLICRFNFLFLLHFCFFGEGDPSHNL